VSEGEEIHLGISLEEHVSKPAEKAGHSLEELHEGLGRAEHGLEEVSLGFLKVVEPAEVAHKAFEEAGEGLKSFVAGLKSGEMKEVIEGVTETVAGLAQGLDLLVPGLGQVASAAIKMAGAVVGGFAGIIQEGEMMALEVGEVNEKLVATFDALGHDGPESGQRTLDMLNKLSTKLPQSRDQLAEWTKQLEKTGVGATGGLGEVQHQLKATAAAEAAFGDAEGYLKVTGKIQNAVETTGKLTLSTKLFLSTVGGVANAIDVAERLHMTLGELEKGLKAGTIDAQGFGNALSATMIEKGEKPLDAMGNELETLKTKGKETFGHLFDDIDASPVTDALKTIIDIGDQSEPSGQALKAGFTGAFNAISKMVGEAIVEFGLMFQSIEITALEAWIALKPVIDGMHELGILKKDQPNDARADYKPKPPPPTTRHPMARAEAIGVVLPIARAEAIGIGLVEGLQTYVKSKYPSLFQTGKDMSGSVIEGAKVGADAHSPSRLTMKLGMNLTEGLAQGIDASAGIPERAGRRISGAAIGGMSQGAMGGGSSGGGGGGTQVDKFEVNINAPDGVTDANQISVSALAIALERFQLAVGR
jgi:hypothetical protein